MELCGLLLGSLVLATEPSEPLGIHGRVSIPDAQDDVAERAAGVLATALQFDWIQHIFKSTNNSDKSFLF